MSAVFLKLVYMSIGAGWLVLAAVLFRLVFKKAPKALRCIVWALVAVRLLLPFTIESPFGLVPSAESIPERVIASARADNALPNEAEPARYGEEGAVPEFPPEELTISVSYAGRISSLAEEPAVPAVQEEPEPREKPDATLRALSVVWLVGASAMMLYTLVSYIRLRRSIRASVPAGEGVIACDSAPTPFIMGIFRPVIVLPSSISPEDARFATAHEKAHLERRDHLIKPFGFALLSVYWFNPLMWLAYILLCRDIELACDERVIRKGGAGIKKGYSEALINCSVMQRRISACPVAFGEVGLKERVKSVLSYKRSTAAVMLAALLCCMAIGVFLIPNRSAAAAEPAEQADEEEPLPAAAFMDFPGGYDMIYLLGGLGEGEGAVRLLLSSISGRYAFEEIVDGNIVVTDSGSYDFINYNKLRFKPDSGSKHFFLRRYEDRLLLDREGKYSFCSYADKLTSGTSAGHVSVDLTASDVNYTIAFQGMPHFRLHRSTHYATKYYYYNGSCYIWYPETGRLYLFGDPQTVLREVLKEPEFMYDPDLGDKLEQAVTKLGISSVGCCMSVEDGKIEGITTRNHYDLDSIVFAAYAGHPTIAINVMGRVAYNPDYTGHEATQLTPGSRFARGGPSY